MKNRILFLEAAIVLLFPGSIGNRALSQWSGDPDINLPVCTAAGQKSSVQICSDGAKGAFLVWIDARAGFGKRDLYAQRIDSAGYVQWKPDGVPLCTTATSLINGPKIIRDGSGNAIVVWEDWRSGNGDIYAQKVSPLGEAEWGINGVAVCDQSASQFSPDVAGDGHGGAIVAWYDNRYIEHDLYAQRIDSAGAIRWTDHGVPLSTKSGDQDLPVVIEDGVGGAVVAWMQKVDAEYDIYAQRVESSGVIRWAAAGVTISKARGSQWSPRMATDGAGGAILAWMDYRNGPLDGDIYMQRIDSSGFLPWSRWGCNDSVGWPLCTEMGNPDVPDHIGGAVSDGQGAVLFTWSDLHWGTYDVFFNRVDSLFPGYWYAVAYGPDDEKSPVLASDGTGGAIVVWQVESGGSSNLYAQRMNSSGSRQWSTDAEICTAAGNQTDCVVTADGAGGAILAWLDGRNGKTDVYAQRISHQGQLTSVGRGNTSGVPGMFALSQNYPNPFNSSTVIQYQLPVRSRVLLKVYNLLGQEVATLLDDVMPAGYHSVGLDASNYPSGVYFYRLQADRMSATRYCVLLR